MTRILAALALACALSVAACAPRDGSGPGTSAAGWHQIAVGVGAVVGPTRADTSVAKASEQLDRYCGGLRAVAALGTLFATSDYARIVREASAVVATVCERKPKDVAAALVTAAAAYAAAQAAGAL